MSDFAPGHLMDLRQSHLLAINISNLTWFCVNSGFCHEADENSALLGYYRVSIGSSLETFRTTYWFNFQGALVDGTDRLSRKVGKELPLLSAKITQNSAFLLHDFLCYHTALHQAKVKNLYSGVSFCDGSFYDDSLLWPLPRRTEYYRIVVHHCRN